MKTYEQWILTGRAVKRGEKAHRFAVSPDGSQRVALFAEDQTVELVVPDISDWREVSRDEVPGVSRAAAAPIVRVDYDSEVGEVQVWCGRNKELQSRLKQSGWDFDWRAKRWTMVRDEQELDSICRRLTAYRVKLTVDGELVGDYPAVSKTPVEAPAAPAKDPNEGRDPWHAQVKPGGAFESPAETAERLQALGLPPRRPKAAA